MKSATDGDMKCGFLFQTISGVLIAFVISLAGCDRPKSQVGANQTSRVRDQAGKDVTIPVPPRAILSLCSSATDTLIRLGEKGRLAAIDEFSCVVPGAEDCPVFGKGGAISRERVVAGRIDLAFVWWFQDDAAHLLEDIGVPVVRLRTGRAGELSETIRLIGKCVNREEDAARLAQSLSDWAAKNAPTPASNRPRVYIELYGPLKTIGKDSYTNDVIEMAGGENIAAGKSGRVLFSVEGLVQADPDVVLVVGEAAALQAAIQRPEMARLRAVREGRAFAVPPAWLIPGAELPVAVVKFRAIIHTNTPKG